MFMILFVRVNLICVILIIMIELKEEQDFTDEDFETLNQEVDDYALYDYITLDDGEYKICGYGCLQTMFNDDRRKESDELER